MTLEEIKAQAVAENWTGRQIKDALFSDGKSSAANRDAIKSAVEAVFGKREVAAPLASAPVVAVAVSPAPIAVEPVVEAPAEPIKLEDGAIIFCDAARNIKRSAPGRYGRIAEFDNGGARIGIKSGKFSAIFFNTQCYHPKSGEFDQFMAECFSVLKAVEVAKEHGLEHVTIRNDRIGGFDATTKRGYKAATYLYVAKILAYAAGIEVVFDQCAGAENEADKVSRSNA